MFLFTYYIDKFYNKTLVKEGKINSCKNAKLHISFLMKRSQLYEHKHPNCSYPTTVLHGKSSFFVLLWAMATTAGWRGPNTI